MQLQKTWKEGEEYEEHMRTHIPYRQWCPFCAQGKMAANPKKSTNQGEQSEVPIVGWDYMGNSGDVELGFHIAGAACTPGKTQSIPGREHAATHTEG